MNVIIYLAISMIKIMNLNSKLLAAEIDDLGLQHSRDSRHSQSTHTYTPTPLTSCKRENQSYPLLTAYKHTYTPHHYPRKQFTRT